MFLKTLSAPRSFRNSANWRRRTFKRCEAILSKCQSASQCCLCFAPVHSGCAYKHDAAAKQTGARGDTLLSNFLPVKRKIALNEFGRWLFYSIGCCASAAACLVAYLIFRKSGECERFAGIFPVVHAARRKSKDPDTTAADATLVYREQRFLQFASLEYDGQCYMTPADFLDSLVKELPAVRNRRLVLSEKDVKHLLQKTPSRDKASTQLLRTMGREEPKSGFLIAFNMFDTDGNQQVDKNEFLVIEALMLLHRLLGEDNNDTPTAFDSFLIERPSRPFPHVEVVNADYELLVAKPPPIVPPQSSVRPANKSDDADATEKPTAVKLIVKILKEIFGRTKRSQTIKRKKGLEAENQAEPVDQPDTSLLVHFFGKSGKESLSYDDFCKFTENLQDEVLELEFLEFSQGRPIITELEFARILLRYTVVHMDDYQKYLRRVQLRTLDDSEGITLEQFRRFGQFLNSLDDFSIAIKLYTFANLPVSPEEFGRAVKVSTGFSLEPHLIKTVYDIFDVNGDGILSYPEFVAVMKDRVHRGFKSVRSAESERWHQFKSCVRQQMRTY